MYIVAMRPLVDFSNSDGYLLCVAHLAMNLIDNKRQSQRRRNNARLTESGNARSEQLLVMPTESLNDREWVPVELLSELKHLGLAGLDMKYQIC